MTSRYFVESRIEEPLGSATLTGSEAQHLLRVKRAKVGDRVTLFDGSGDEFSAELVAIDRTTAKLSILQRHTIDRERIDTIVLAVSLPKGDRQRVLIEKAVEIGVSRLVPIRTTRSNDFYSDKSLERWQRYVVEASKQCGRNRLMVIDPPQDFTDEFVRSLQPARNAATSIKVAGPYGWIAHPYEVKGQDAAAPPPLPEEPPARTENWIAIGPEGGFTSDEVREAQRQDWYRLDLGPRLLRVETAAIVAVSRFDRDS